MRPAGQREDERRQGADFVQQDPVARVETRDDVELVPRDGAFVFGEPVDDRPVPGEQADGEERVRLPEVAFAEKVVDQCAGRGGDVGPRAGAACERCDALPEVGPVA